MKKSVKLLAALLAAVLLIGGGSLATYAYLTSQSEKVENTFTSGNVTITLDETKVDEYGVVLTGDKAGKTQSNEYKLVPACTYAKDPTIHVEKGSEPCYVFVKVENGLADIEAEGTTTIAAQMAAKGWTAISEGSNVYYYNSTVDARTEAKDLVVFESFTIAASATNDNISSHKDAKIVVYGYACQAAGFDTAVAAWNAAFNK